MIMIIKRYLNKVVLSAISIAAVSRIPVSIESREKESNIF